MKIRSLLLGSIAAAGLVATGAHAADLGVATSLDVCDALGLSGLTISSDTNCLQISGGVSYEFGWGDFANSSGLVTAGAGTFSVKDNLPSNVAMSGTATVTTTDQTGNDWDTKLIAWLQFVGTADSDFGPAKAVIKFKNEQYRHYINGTDLPSVATASGYNGSYYDGDDTTNLGSNGGWNIDRAYVAVGDSTVIMAGKVGSIINYGDDEPFNWLSTFNSEKVDAGVKASAKVNDGGMGIQVVSDLGNGVSVGAGLEDINDGTTNLAGTAVGKIEYSGSGISAHISGMATGVLDGTVNNYAMHAGFTGTFDAFKLRGAFAADDTGYWNGLASASATFDMFTLAGTVEGVHYGSSVVGNKADTTDWGAGASLSAAVTDGVTLNVGGRWYHEENSDASAPLGWGGGENNAWQIAASVSAAVTETVTLTGEVGAYGSDRFKANPNVDDQVYYGAVQAAWAPGGGFTSSIKGEAYSDGAYKATFKAAKDFQ